MHGELEQVASRRHDVKMSKRADPRLRCCHERTDHDVLIAVAGVKGGSGKSTTSVMLAESAVRRHGESMLIDADPQASATTWASLAENAGDPLGSVVVGIPSSDLRRKLSGVGVERYNLAVIDTPPGDEPIIRAALAQSRVVVIPVRPTGPDIDRLWRTLDMVTETGSRSLVVLAQVRRNTRALAAAESVLSKAGVTLADTRIPARESIATAFGRGIGQPLIDLGDELLNEIERMGE